MKEKASTKNGHGNLSWFVQDNNFSNVDNRLSMFARSDSTFSTEGLNHFFSDNLRGILKWLFSVLYAADDSQ